MVDQNNRVADSSGAVRYPASGVGAKRIRARVGDAALREGNRLTLFSNGPDTYDDWLAATGRARRWVHLDNYNFESDDTSQRFAQTLCEKARERAPSPASNRGVSAPPAGGMRQERRRPVRQRRPRAPRPNRRTCRRLSLRRRDRRTVPWRRQP